MKSNVYYILGIILLVVIGGVFFLDSGSSVNVPDASGSGDYQEVVIGMRNYNYYPNTIKVEVGKPVRISLDNSVVGCFRDFTIKDFGIHKYLKTDKDYVTFTPTEPGTYVFACSMGMGSGTLVVE